jgi:hypothetical protein
LLGKCTTTEIFPKPKATDFLCCFTLCDLTEFVYQFSQVFFFLVESLEFYPYKIILSANSTVWPLPLLSECPVCSLFPYCSGQHLL